MKFKFSEELIVDSDVEPWVREGLRCGVFGAPGSTKCLRGNSMVGMADGSALPIHTVVSEKHSICLSLGKIVGAELEKERDCRVKLPPEKAREKGLLKG